MKHDQAQSPKFTEAKKKQKRKIRISTPLQSF